MKQLRCQSNKGFTLLEIIATLMIIVVISGLAGFSIVNYVDAYSLHKQHTEIVQQARLVINRLVNEFVHITEIRSANNKKIVFCSRFNNLRDTSVVYQNNCLMINNEIFAEHVSNFTLRYLSGVNAFDNVDSQGMWTNQWHRGKSTAIQFDISFYIAPILLRKQRNYSVDFKNITVVPRTLQEVDNER